MSEEQKPFSPKLKSAMDDIRKIIERYDIGAAVVLHTPGNSEYALFVEPSYSCAKLENRGVRFKAKAKDFPGGAKERQQKVEDTANLMNLLASTSGNVSLALMDISQNFDKHIGADHGDTSHREHGSKRDEWKTFTNR